MSAAKAPPALPWTWIFGLVIAAVVGLVLTRPRPPRPAPIEEATQDQLERRDGRLYRTNESAPFTGALVERYPSGEIKSRSLLAGGLLQGASIGWYTNGQMQVREHFQFGVSHGLRTKWYEDGKLMVEGMIIDGEFDGTFRRWHENGQLAETVEMKRGHADGVSLAYHPSGFLKARAVLNDGQVIEQNFWDDGETRLPPMTAKAVSP